MCAVAFVEDCQACNRTTLKFVENLKLIFIRLLSNHKIMINNNQDEACGKSEFNPVHRPVADGLIGIWMYQNQKSTV